MNTLFNLKNTSELKLNQIKQYVSKSIYQDSYELPVNFLIFKLISLVKIPTSSHFVKLLIDITKYFDLFSFKLLTKVKCLVSKFIN